MNFILGSLNPETQRVVDIANVAIFTLALFGLIITLYTLKREKRRDRETTEAATKRDRASFARRLYVDYLKVALVNPDLSIAEFNKDDNLACDKYDTFVSIMLYSFDEMINVGEPQIAEMIPTIDWQIEVHEPYIRILFPIDDKLNWRGQFSAVAMQNCR